MKLSILTISTSCPMSDRVHFHMVESTIRWLNKIEKEELKFRICLGYGDSCGKFYLSSETIAFAKFGTSSETRF